MEASAHQMIPYISRYQSPIDHSAVFGAFAMLAILGMATRGTPTTSPEVEELQEKLKMAHEHQAILESDIDILEASVSHLINAPSAETSENIHDAILTLLKNSKVGMTCKDLKKSLTPSMPGIEKKHINSMLYKMNNMKLIQQKNTSENAPIWKLV